MLLGVCLRGSPGRAVSVTATNALKLLVYLRSLEYRVIHVRREVCALDRYSFSGKNSVVHENRDLCVPMESLPAWLYLTSS